MLEILVLLFHNYAKTNLSLLVNIEALSLELKQIGYHPKQVQQAFAWLKTVSDMLRQYNLSDEKQLSSKSIRVFTEDECQRLSVESRGLLIFLEVNGVIDAMLREFIIERALALDSFIIGLEQIKWVITIVILNSHTHNKLIQWLDENDELDDDVELNEVVQGAA